MRETKKTIRSQRDAAWGYSTVLERQLESLRARLGAFLAIVNNAGDNLAAVFGPVDYVGPDADDQFMRFAARDGLAEFTLNPATGALYVFDPQKLVKSVSVSIDEQNQLDEEEQARIRRFRADVVFSRRDDGTAKVGGPVLLTARSESPAVEVTVVDAIDA